MNRQSILLAIGCLLLACEPLRAQTVEITVEGGKEDLVNVPVCVPLSMPKGAEVRPLGRDSVLVRVPGQDQAPLFGQVTAPGDGSHATVGTP